MLAEREILEHKFVVSATGPCQRANNHQPPVLILARDRRDRRHCRANRLSYQTVCTCEYDRILRSAVTSAAVRFLAVATMIRSAGSP